MIRQLSSCANNTSLAHLPYYFFLKHSHNLLSLLIDPIEWVSWHKAVAVTYNLRHQSAYECIACKVMVSVSLCIEGHTTLAWLCPRILFYKVVAGFQSEAFQKLTKEVKIELPEGKW